MRFIINQLSSLGKVTYGNYFKNNSLKISENFSKQPSLLRVSNNVTPKHSLLWQKLMPSLFSVFFSRQEAFKINSPIRNNQYSRHFYWNAFSNIPQNNVKWMFFSTLASGFRSAQAFSIKNDGSAQADTSIEDRLCELMIEGAPKIRSVKDRDIVLVVGNTGAGKSALINYMMGKKMVQDPYTRRIYTTEIGDPKISNDIINSETLHSEAFEVSDDESKYYFCDFPGFEETRGEPEQIWTSINRELAINMSKSIKSIIVVIDYNSFDVGKAFDFMRLITTLDKIFISLDEKEFATFAITKTEDIRDIGKINVISKINMLIEGYENTRKNKKSLFRRKRQILSQGNSVSSDAEEINKLLEVEAGLKILNWMKENENNIVVVNMLDGINSNTRKSKNAILDCVKSRKNPILKDHLRISNATSGPVTRMQDLLSKISGFGSNKLEQRKRLLTRIHNNRREIDNLGESAKNMVKINRDIIYLNQGKINQLSSEIENLKNELSNLDQDVPWLYWEDEAKEKRSFLGKVLFSYTKKEFEYPHKLPYLYVHKNSVNNYGSFQNKVKDKENGIWKATYCSWRRYDADAEVKLYVKKKDILAHSMRISEIKDDIKNKDEECKLLREDIIKRSSMNEDLENALNDTANTKRIFDKYFEVTELESKLSSDIRNLGEVNKSLRENYEKFRVAGEIISYSSLGTGYELMKNFSQRFSEYLIENAKQAESQVDALDYYDAAAYIDKENPKVFLEKASYLLKVKNKVNYGEIENLCKIAEGLDPIGNFSKDIDGIFKEIKVEHSRSVIAVQSRRLNPYVCSLMSELTYYDPKSPDSAAHKECADCLSKLGWEVLSVVSEDDLNNGYYGIAFRNKSIKQIVIAHRGTKPTDAKSFTADLQLILGDKPDQYQSAETFINSIMKDYGKEYTIGHTGHSLGGSLAALSAHDFNSFAVVFDPFGIKNIIVGEKDQIDFKRLPITSYLSLVNIVNGSAPHVGLVFQLIPSELGIAVSNTEKAVEVIALLLEHNYNNWGKIVGWLRDDVMVHHSISRIRNSFNKNYGSPRQLFLVEKWPENPIECLRFYNLLDKKLGLKQRMIIREALIDQKAKAQYDSINHSVIGYSTPNKLNLKYFDIALQEIIRGYIKNPQKSPEYEGILHGCKVEIDSVTNEEYFLTPLDTGITVLDIKLYLERKICFKNQQDFLTMHQNDNQNPNYEILDGLKGQADENTPESANNYGFFRQTIYKYLLPSETKLDNSKSNSPNRN